MDYTTLTSSSTTAGSIASFLNNSNSSFLANVPTFIADAEASIYRRLRHWRMLTPPTSSTMSVGVDQISPPSDFLDPYQFYLTGASSSVPGYGPQLISLATPEQVIANYSWDSSGNRLQMTPQMYYFNSTYLQLDSPPDQAYPYSLIYYQQPAALSTTITNWVTQYYPRMLRAAILAEATEFTKESGSGNFDRTYWLQIAQNEIETAQAESDFAKRSASNMTGMIGL